MQRHHPVTKFSLLGAIAFSVLGLMMNTSFAHAACVIVQGGKAKATIVVPDKPLPIQFYAAQELQYHIERASGVKVPMAKESDKPREGSIIYVGPCQEAEGHNLHPESLEPNAYLIRCEGDALFLAGKDSEGSYIQDATHAGTLFAVYTFLEEQLGVRWLWPGKLGEVVPARADIEIGELNENKKPVFIHARVRFGGEFQGPVDAWASAQDRGQYAQDVFVWLRRHHFARSVSMDISHSFSGYWARFGVQHPDYFNLLPDGTRRPDPFYANGEGPFVSMNVSNPALWRQVVEQWQAHRTAFSPYIDASEDDTMGKDTSPQTMAWDVPDPNAPAAFAERLRKAKAMFNASDPNWPKALGPLADRYAHFWLEIQREAEKVDPNAVVMGLAYDNYVEPPLATKLNNRIIIGIVPDVSFPWSQNLRESFRKTWLGWSEAGARLLLRPNYFLDGHDYPINFAREFAEDFQFAYQHGMIGTDFDSLTGQWAAQGPDLYMLARIQEHPDWSADKILDEYYAGFGKGAEHVKAYFDHWEQVTNGVHTQYGDPFHFYVDAPAVFTEASLRQGQPFLDEAMRAVQGNAVDELRVKFLSDGLRHAELTLAVENAHRNGNGEQYRAAISELDTFRSQHEKEYISDIGFLRFTENKTWNRAGTARVVAADRNLLANGGFDAGAKGWNTQVMCGAMTFAIDNSEHHDGQSCARITCTGTVAPTAALANRTAWGRWYQSNVHVEKGATYRLSAWVKTSNDFQGKAEVWFNSGANVAGTMEPTQGAWRQVVIENLHPQFDTANVYLNLVDGTGTVWFDEVLLEKTN